jgi:hypothetical protein
MARAGPNRPSLKALTRGSLPRRHVESYRAGDAGATAGNKTAEGNVPSAAVNWLEGHYVAGGGTLGALLGVIADLRAFGQ